MVSITVIISAHPARFASYLPRALMSVCAQTLQPKTVVVATDLAREGAAATKNRALRMVDTEWTAVLDSDDQFMACHLEKLAKAQSGSGADVVYSWPAMDCAEGATDPVPEMFGVPFSGEELRKRPYVHTAVLMRTRLALEAGGFQCRMGESWDDYGLWLAMLDAGAVFHHHPERTWIWTIHGQNTSGQPHRGDAA
jgi:glycosyltransferase involved in cell wall biosynthesis